MWLKDMRASWEDKERGESYGLLVETGIHGEETKNVTRGREGNEERNGNEKERRWKINLYLPLKWCVSK